MAEHGKVQGKRKRTRGLRRAARRAVRPHAYSHPVELRRKAVQLCLEEGFPVKQVARELGVGFSTLGAWVRRYRAQGEAGLQGKARPRSPRPQVAAAVKRQTVELKRRQPDFGIQKISQFLRRVLFLPVSRETVRRTLHAHQLLQKPRPKPQRNPPRPRFFERATPNQLWQTDIFTFRLGGKHAYLIGFLDDHSRYVVGLDVFRSQTAEHVLEVYRRAVAEYGVPKELHRSGPAVRQLAGHDPLRGRAPQGSRALPAESAPELGDVATLLTLFPRRGRSRPPVAAAPPAAPPHGPGHPVTATGALSVPNRPARLPQHGSHRGDSRQPRNSRQPAGRNFDCRMSRTQ